MRNHSFDGSFDNELGVTAATGLGRFGFMTANITGKTHIFLLNFLFSGEDGFLGVDHNHMIAGVNVSGENGLVFAAKQHGGFFGDSTDDLIVCIDNIPLTFNLFCFGAKSFHREPEIKP